MAYRRRTTRRTTRYAAPRRSARTRVRRYATGRRRVSARRRATPRTQRLVIQVVSASPVLGVGNQMVKGAQTTRRMF